MNELEKRLAEIWAKLSALHDLSVDEGRDLTDYEEAKFAGVEQEQTGVKQKVKTWAPQSLTAISASSLLLFVKRPSEGLLCLQTNGFCTSRQSIKEKRALSDWVRQSTAMADSWFKKISGPRSSRTCTTQVHCFR